MSNLEYHYCNRSELDESMLKRMYFLMEEAYEEINYERFVSDLDKKQLVLLLQTKDGLIQGFTTFAVNPANSGTADYAILFSGDTIIHPAYWGSLALLKGWCAAVAHLMKQSPDCKWYWFLLSKGHRTYMFLPLFFKQYFPCMDSENRVPDSWLEIQDRTASLLYSESYKKGVPVLKFNQPLGQLNAPLAKSSYDRKANPHIDFFLQLNPDFERGDELLCFTWIHPDNMKGYPATYLKAALEDKA